VGLANQLVSDGKDVSVCVTRCDLTLSAELHSSIPVAALDRKSSFDLAGFQRFLRFVQQQKPDVFHAHGRSSFSFLAFLKTLGRISTPIIFHDHMGIQMDETIPLWFRWWGHGFVAYYVGVYDKLAEWASLAGVPKQNIAVIGNAINIKPYLESEGWDLRSRFNVPKDTMIGVMVGGLRREKGLDLLVQAVGQARFLNRIHVLVVGNKLDGQYVETCLHEMGVQNIDQHFTFLGQQEEIPAILGGADFALMPSRAESGPLVLIEYLAAGLPVVAFCVGAISHSASQYGVRGFVQPGDVARFASELDQLVAMPAHERVERGLFGKRVAQENFDIMKIMPQWNKIYQHVLADREVAP
jgi:glycosyltransferase involved in cell wall biosynthesis